jgi:myo-inositol 2-dehydrogenase / D-chiro-inositol 1-dehydrogenase
MVGVAVAGLGEIGRLHARNLATQVPGARLVRLADPVPGVGERLSRELGVPWSPAYSDALADPAVDAVVIAAPTPLHAEMVVEAAAAGRHVFCEKPLSLDPAGGRAAACAMRAAGLSLQVGFQRRFEPGWVAAAHRIAAGQLGEVQLLRIAHRNRRHPHGGGTDRLGSLFVDMTVHDMDSARWLVGEVATVSAFEAEGSETAVIVLRFERGALGVIDNTRTAGYGFECSAEVMGTAGTIRLGANGRSLETLTPAGLVVELPADHIERHAPAYLAELRHFVRCLSAGERPEVGAEQANAALELALAAERSLRR